MTDQQIVYCTAVISQLYFQVIITILIGIGQILCFEVVTTLALIIGLVVINIPKRGAGMQIDVTSLDTKAVEYYITEKALLSQRVCPQYDPRE